MTANVAFPKTIGYLALIEVFVPHPAISHVAAEHQTVKLSVIGRISAWVSLSIYSPQTAITFLSYPSK